LVNPVSSIRLLQGPKASQERRSAAVTPAADFAASPQPVSAVFSSAFREQSSFFLAQLLAAEAPYQGVELDMTRSFISRYAEVVRVGSPTRSAVDLTI
jgi:hypothetical protein